MTTPRFSLQEMVEFLCGEDPLDGVWFGEAHPSEPGKFWWRKHLRAAVEAAASSVSVLDGQTKSQKPPTGS
jgi:hypothetical protein